MGEIPAMEPCGMKWGILAYLLTGPAFVRADSNSPETSGIQVSGLSGWARVCTVLGWPIARAFVDVLP